MKTRLFTLSAFLLSASLAFAQTTIFTEHFGDGCDQGQLATAYSGPNGSWTMTSLVNGNAANQWYVSAMEAGRPATFCGDGCGNTPALTNASLHVGNVEVVYLNVTIADADHGASYNQGGIGAFGFFTETDRRIESPVISTVGFQNIELSFNYIEGGNALDNAELHINYGSGWGLHADLAKTATCPGGQGVWTTYTTTLNAAADLSNLQIGFKWVNNDDSDGTDPSFAVDFINITGDISTGIQQPDKEFSIDLNNRLLSLEIPDVDEEIIRVLVTNILGKTISSFEGRVVNGQLQIDLGHAAAGVHLINIVSDNQRFTRKFVLN